MFMKFIKKFKNVICLILMFCIIVPIVGACGKRDNKLTYSSYNKIIGKGANISAYTTYSQAKFIEMDQDMYYSYLMAYRDFILVVLPDKDNDGQPDNDNLMFQAAYSGVTPYSESFVNGNFSFKNPEYKLVIYYVLAKDLLSWDDMAFLEEETGLITRAFDVLGPLADISNDMKASNDTVKRMKYYVLRNLANNNRYVSECDFISKYSVDIPDKCVDYSKHVVENVKDGTSNGLTLLYRSGGINGYFTYEDVASYDVTKSTWINKLLNHYNENRYTKVSIEEYLTEMIEKNVCNTELGKNLSSAGGNVCDNISSYVQQMLYKLKFDMALLNRIDKIHYNTLLDINTSSQVTTGINDAYQGNVSRYNQLLKGDSTVNNGNYITFTTAEGFIIDRGDIMETGFIDALLDTNILAGLSMIDACTNRSLASYVAELYATIGIGLGGIMVGAGAVAAVAAGLISVGLVSSSVPVVGWVVGAACLLIAGTIVLVESISAKKALDETDSANYCKIFEEVIEEIISMSYVKLPVYNYNIPEDDERTVDLCYLGEYEKDENGVESCNSDFDVAAFKYADMETVDQLSSLSGAPSLRLYSNGKLVDEIYGSASPTFIYAIMDSWGVTAATNMKYYTTLNKGDEGIKTIDVYDLLSGSDSKNTITGAQYCISTKYGEPCVNGKSLSLSRNSFVNGKYSLNYSGQTKVDIDAMRQTVVDSIVSNASTREPIDFANYEVSMKNAANAEVNFSNSYVEDIRIYVNVNGNKIEIVEQSNGSIYIKDDKLNIINVETNSNYYTFNYSNDNYGVVKNSDGSYSVIKMSDFDSMKSAIENIFNKMTEVDKIDSSYFNDTKGEYIEKIIELKMLKDEDSINEHVHQYILNLMNINYSSGSVPIYFTISITEKDSEGNTNFVSSSTLFENYTYEIALGGN